MKLAQNLIILAILMMTVSISAKSPDKGLLIFVFPKDAYGSSLGYEKIEVWKSDWADYARDDFEFKYTNKYNAADVKFSIVNPENYYIHYKSVSKKGYKRVFIASSKSSEKIEVDRVRIQDSVSNNSKMRTQHTLVEKGKHPLKLRGRDKLTLSKDVELNSDEGNRYDQLLKLSGFSAEKTDCVIEGDKKEYKKGKKPSYTIHQEYSGIFKIVSNIKDDGSYARLNIRRAFKSGTSVEDRINALKKDVSSALSAVCGNNADSSFIKSKIQNMRAYMRQIDKESREKAYKKCVDAKRDPGICNKIRYPNKASATGVTG
jgi:hypothetical protein